MSKRWKVNGFDRHGLDGQKFSDFRRQVVADEQISLRGR